MTLIAVMLCPVGNLFFFFFFLSPLEPASENVWNKQSAVVTSCWSFYRAESHRWSLLDDGR